MVDVIKLPKMRGAELKTMLGGLGLPPSWFADYMDVTMRTVVRWFDSETVAPEVAAAVAELEDMTTEEMTRLRTDALATADGCVTLQTFRTDKEVHDDLPASWHRALTFRLREQLRAEGRVVVVEYR